GTKSLAVDQEIGIRCWNRETDSAAYPEAEMPCSASRIKVDPGLSCQITESLVGRPQPVSSYKSGCQQVNVDPADTTSVQVSAPDKGDDITVRNHPRLGHLLVAGQEFLSALAVSDQQFPVD